MVGSVPMSRKHLADKPLSLANIEFLKWVDRLSVLECFKNWRKSRKQNIDPIVLSLNNNLVEQSKNKYQKALTDHLTT